MLRWAASWGPQAPRGATEEHDPGQSTAYSNMPADPAGWWGGLRDF